jgi:undecaprenyl phosphate-alpha-L-ara4N flippase subunit ArnE
MSLAVGQLLFKFTAQSMEGENFNGYTILHLFSNPWFIFALFICGGATILWVWVLRQVPLTVAYPFFALSFVIVPFLSSVFLGEHISLNYWIGVGLIIAGIVVTVTTMP